MIPRTVPNVGQSGAKSQHLFTLSPAVLIDLLFHFQHANRCALQAQHVVQLVALN
jgi:hypothetical protein